MKQQFRITCLVFVLAIGLPLSVAGADFSAAPEKIPQTGASAKFGGPEIAISAADSGISPQAIGQALTGLPASDGDTVRGGNEANLYRRISPAVVLVVTDEGLGSGSLISKDGLIITNWHVIAGYDTVGVLQKPEKEGEELTPSQVILADVVKFDQVADLALLRMRTPPRDTIVPIAFGDFSTINVGDDVDAIGHPQGEAWTFTRGYVSQIRRDYDWKTEAGKAHKADVIQTQTPINPGNSGGPLLNSDGALIGVNAFKGEGEGLSFAVGVDAVQTFLASSESRFAQDVVQATSRDSQECKPQLMFEGRASEDDASLQVFDMDCDGKANIMLVLPDDKDEPLYALLSKDNDLDHPDGLVLSYERDGSWNISYWDSDGDGEWDLIGYHPDGKLFPTSYGPYQKK